MTCFVGTKPCGCAVAVCTDQAELSDFKRRCFLSGMTVAQRDDRWCREHLVCCQHGRNRK